MVAPNRSLLPPNAVAYAMYRLGNPIASALGVDPSSPLQLPDFNISNIGEQEKDVLRTAVNNAKRAGRSFIKYEDYPPLADGMSPAKHRKSGRLSEETTAVMARRSFEDPVYAMYTLLGVFNFKETEDGGFTIDDEYNFDRSKTRKDYKPTDKFGEAIVKGQEISENETLSFNVSGTILPKGVSPLTNIKDNVRATIAGFTSEASNIQTTLSTSQPSGGSTAAGKITANISNIGNVIKTTGVNYASRFFDAIENELSLEAIADDNITTEKFSPESLGTIKHALDKYFAANPNQTEVETSSSFLGFDSETLMDQVVAKRTFDGGYQLVDASDPSQNNNILTAGRRYAQGLAEQIDQSVTASTDWFANQFQEDSINIDIKIPPVMEAVSDAMDDYFGIEETAMIPKFRPNPLTKSRLDKMNAVLNETQIPEIEQPNNLDVLGFGEAFSRSRGAGQSIFTWRGNDYTTRYKDEQESLDGEDTSMDAQGGQEPEGGIERSGSGIVQEGDAQATS